MKKLFEVHQKITLLANEYAILKDEKPDKQNIVAYARQKRLAFREQFTLYDSPEQKTILATSKARQVMDLAPTFDIFDSSGKPLAVLKKDFKKSLLTSSWSIYDPAMKNVLYQIAEKSLAIAVLRRLWELIPLVSEVSPFPLKFHFSIKSADQIVGEYIKTTTIRDHYALYLNQGEIIKMDERGWMVMAVLLDAMQSR